MNTTTFLLVCTDTTSNIQIILPKSCLGTWEKINISRMTHTTGVFLQQAEKKLSRNLLNIHTLNFKTGGFDMVDAFNSCNLSSISLNLENRDLSEIH